MNQKQIDDLLRDSMFQSSSISQSQQPQQPISKQNQYDSYNAQQFESYDDSKQFNKSNQYKNQSEQTKKNTKELIKLEEIKEQSSPVGPKKSIQAGPVQQKTKNKKGIYFDQPPKRPSSASKPQNKHLPHNYNQLESRQKQLLFTTITQQNVSLKQNLRMKEIQFKNLENSYKILLIQKSKNSPTVKQSTLEKQLSILQTKYDKLQSLAKISMEKGTYNHPHLSKTQNQPFIPQPEATRRQQQLLAIIDKLKDRLINSDNSLKILQTKLNQGENYIDELKRKMKRVEQLEHKMDKMTEQAQNDRALIDLLKQKIRNQDQQITQLQNERKKADIAMQRMQLAQYTQTDLRQQLIETRKQKQLLEQSLKQLSSNFMSKITSNFKELALDHSTDLLNPH